MFIYRQAFRLYTFIIGCFLLTLPLSLQGQTSTDQAHQQATLAISGQFLFSANQDNIFFNLGGSGIQLKINHTTVSANFLPSLRYNFDTEKLSPTLGFGPQVLLKNGIIFGTPLYYINNQWIITFGLGYKWSASKKN